MSTSGVSYDTVVFDSDGVLVEPPTRETQLGATRAAFREMGVEDVDHEHLMDIVNGVTSDRLSALCAGYDLEPAEFWAVRERHDERSQFEAFRAGDRTCYDDIDVVLELSQRCGVVSNNHHSTIEFVLSFFGLQSAFDTYYGRPKTIESLALKKPNPHYLERALAELEAENDSALYVGDRETDIVAAERAGIDSAFVRRSHCRGVELAAAPTHEIADLSEIEPLISG
ncbi:HAD family hydrolase [Halocatena salina]|uniref:HAD family hydrolase n=1 Tax=Halocatena salina TaxID=2934340 RepID=UPI0034A533A7